MLWTGLYHLTVCHESVPHDHYTTGSDNGLSPGRRQAIIWTNATQADYDIPQSSYDQQYQRPLLIEDDLGFKKRLSK